MLYSRTARRPAPSYAQLRPARRLSASHLLPQPLPQPLLVPHPAKPAPAPAEPQPASAPHPPPSSPRPSATAHPPAPASAAHPSPTASPPASSSASPPPTPPAVPDALLDLHHRPHHRPQDRPVHRPAAAGPSTSRPTSAAAETLSHRVCRRDNLHNRALLAKRLRGASAPASSSTSSLTDLASSPTVVAPLTHPLPPPDRIDQMARTHRRRASESSGYFAAHRSKRPHSDHIIHPAAPVPIPAKKRPLSLSDFRLSKVLGSGGSATVVRAEPIPGSHAASAIPVKEVALKAVSKKGLNRRAQHYLAREIAIHRSVQNHPNIASLYEVFEDSSGIYLALELLRGSDLYSVLRRERRGFGEKVALTVVAQILNALQYMHGLGCAHRDIKPENLMFTERPNLQEGKLPQVKLIDFGLACARNPNAPEKDRTSSEKCGTVRYAAPEIVTQTAYVPEQCDIWSVGVVLYSIIAHRNPYTGKTEKEMLQQIQHSELSFDGMEWERISKDTKELIRWCMSRKASERPTSAQALLEIQRILNFFSASDSHGMPSDDGTWERRSSRRRAGQEPQRPHDLSGFSSNVTREGSSSHGRRDGSTRGEGSSSPSRSSTDDGVNQPANFFDGLVKAWFSNSSPERHGSE